MTPRQDPPVVRVTAEQARTLYVRLMGVGKAATARLGYRVTGMQQFSSIRPWRGVTLLSLSHGYLVVWCDRENEQASWHRGEVDAREGFWRTFELMRDSAADLVASEPELPKVD